MERIKEFLLNLSDDDIDLKNKIHNMYGAEINNNILYNILIKSEPLQRKVCYHLRDIINDDLDFYAEIIAVEANHLFEEGLIEKEDFNAGLYNCDSLYVKAIQTALSLEG